jgi:hypothetical protein
MRKRLILSSFLTLSFFSFSVSALTIDELLNQQLVEAGKSNTSKDSVAVSPSVVDAGRPSAIGGTRSISVQGVAGNYFGRNRLYVDLDTNNSPTMGHSQDVYTKGISTISWDGDTNPNTLNSNGLGGVDFTQDEADAFRVRVASFDSPEGSEAMLIVRVHSGNGVSQSSQVLVNQITSATDIDFPFSGFNSVQGGGANWKSVGAVELIIDGSQYQALDLSIQSVGTNGKCALVPDSSKQVIDVCKVCDGDGKSCLDCKGIPFGEAKVDRCQICGGDGTSCLGCQESDQGSTLRRLDNTAKQQENLIKNITLRVTKYDSSDSMKKLIKRKLVRAHKLQVRNWTLSWKLPIVSNRCTNTQFCAQISTLPILNEYRTNAKKLFAIANELIRRLAKNKKAKATAKRFDLKNVALYKQAIDLAAKIPEYDSAC